MWTDWEDRRRIVAEGERKAIARWFSPSPAGLLFHGDDGTARPIAPDVARRFETEAQAMVDAFLDEEPVHVVLSFGCGIAAAIVTWCIADLFGLPKHGALVAGFGVTLAFAHLYPMIRLEGLRQRHRELRARIAESLRATAPVPAALGQRYRRTNPFRPALQIVVGLIVLLAMIAMEDDRLMAPLVGIAMLGVPVAWVLFALSRHRDAYQDRSLR